MARAQLDTFDATVEKTNLLLRAIDERFGWGDRERAYLAARAVLQTLRDRLTPEHAMGLGAQLPMLVRGFYVEGWQPTHTPKKMSKDEFVGEVERLIDPLSYTQDTEEVVRGVVAVVQAYTDQNEVRKIKATLPHDIRAMLDESSFQPLQRSA